MKKDGWFDIEDKLYIENHDNWLKLFLSKYHIPVSHYQQDHTVQNYHICCDSSHAFFSSELLSVEFRM
mgnify:CR=1 FL=1